MSYYSLWQVTSPWFVCGITLGNLRTVERVCPILGYMMGWTAERVEDYCAKRRWTLTTGIAPSTVAQPIPQESP